MSLKNLKTTVRIAKNTNISFSLLVADKTAITIDEQLRYNIMQKFFNGQFADDGDIDAGTHDFKADAGIYVSETCVTPANLNNLENIPSPVISASPLIALDTLKLGDSSGGAGTSYGTSAAQTDIDIVDNTHNITWNLSVASLTIQSSANLNWIRTADLAPGAISLATIAGDATKTVLAVLPTDSIDEVGSKNAGVYMFFGGYEASKFNDQGMFLLDQIITFGLNQTRENVLGRIMDGLSDVLQTGRQKVYPDLVAQTSIGTNVVSAAANFTYGNYTTIIPATTITNPFHVIGIHVPNVSDATEEYQVEISRLSDNSIIGVVRLTAAFFNSNIVIPVESPKIVANEGIQVRLAKANNAGSSKNIDMCIVYSEF